MLYPGARRVVSRWCGISPNPFQELQPLGYVKNGLAFDFDGLVRLDKLRTMKPLADAIEPSREHADLRDLVSAAMTALIDAEDQILQLSDGGNVDAHGRQTLDDISAVTGRLKIWTGTFGDPKLDPWPALASAESAISDWQAALRKGYVAEARAKVFSVMDALRDQQAVQAASTDTRPKA